MSLTWRGDLADGLRVVLAKSQHLDDDVAAGAEIILADSNERVPKESGDLAATGSVEPTRGGDGTVGIVYSSVYARWQHEHTFFKHPTGGEAKFLETAQLVKGNEAINKAGEHLWRRL